MRMFAATLVAAMLFAHCAKDAPTAPEKKIPVADTTTADTATHIAFTTSVAFTEGDLGYLGEDADTCTGGGIGLSGDAAVFSYQNALYVIDRTNSVLTRLEGGVDTPNVAYQSNVGTGSNPKNILFISSTKAYITRYNIASLLIINLETGDSTGHISLAPYVAFAGTDSAKTAPQMDAGCIVAGKVYIACQRLDPDAWFAIADTSLVLVINGSTNAVEKAIRLSLRNPVDMKANGGKLYVSCVGAYGINDGGIEVINLATGASEGVIIDEAGFYGDMTNFILSGSRGFMMAGAMVGGEYLTKIVPFDLSDSTVDAALSYISDGFGGLATDNEYVYVGERGGSTPGIVVIDPVTGVKVKGPIATGMAPYSLALWTVQ